MSRLIRQQSGDTIIEVLVALTVIGAVLAGAFVATNYNLKQTRSAEERTIALKFAESQLEQVNANAGTAKTVFTQAPPFNMQSGNPNAGATNLQNGSGILYNISVDRKPVPGIPNQYQFIATVTWDSATGSGPAATDQAILAYKVDK